MNTLVSKRTTKIFRLLNNVNRAIRRSEPDAWLDLNLTIGQLKCLFFINYTGSTNLSKLATALNVTPPNVTGIIDRLVEQGLVKREENPQNRRMLVLTLTEKGTVLLAGLWENNINHLEHILSRLSDADLALVTEGLTVLAHAAARFEEK